MDLAHDIAFTVHVMGSMTPCDLYNLFTVVQPLNVQTRKVKS